jgi:putative FmdB family regulatory protein
MPIYEFECTECQNQFESVLKISESHVKPPCKCGGETTKLISLPSPLQLGGDSGIARDNQTVRKRNKDIWNSPAGRDMSRRHPSTSNMYKASGRLHPKLASPVEV